MKRISTKLVGVASLVAMALTLVTPLIGVAPVANAADDDGVPQHLNIDGKDYQLVFNDEFNGTKLDSSKWELGKDVVDSTYNQNSFYNNITIPNNQQKSTVYLEDGQLHLHSIKNQNKSNKDFYDRVAKVISPFLKSKAAFRYGYLEIGVNFPRTNGVSSFYGLRKAEREGTDDSKGFIFTQAAQYGGEPEITSGVISDYGMRMEITSDDTVRNKDYDSNFFDKILWSKEGIKFSLVRNDEFVESTGSGSAFIPSSANTNFFHNFYTYGDEDIVIDSKWGYNVYDRFYSRARLENPMLPFDTHRNIFLTSGFTPHAIVSDESPDINKISNEDSELVIDYVRFYQTKEQIQGSSSLKVYFRESSLYEDLDPVDVKMGTKLGDLPTPKVLDGYEFRGWFYDSELTHRVSPNDVPSVDIELYALMHRLGKVNIPKPSVVDPCGVNNAYWDLKSIEAPKVYDLDSAYSPEDPRADRIDAYEIKTEGKGVLLVAAQNYVFENGQKEVRIKPPLDSGRLCLEIPKNPKAICRSFWDSKWVFPEDNRYLWTKDDTYHRAFVAANKGYQFANGRDKLTYLMKDWCVKEIPIPKSPSVKDPCGPDNARWDVPKNDSQIVWKQENGHLIATAKEGYLFSNEKEQIDFGVAKDSGKACVKTVALPEVPGVNDPCGAGNASWVLPKDSAQLAWSLVDGRLVVKAKPGFQFAGGKSTHDFGVAKDSGKACPVKVVELKTLPVVKNAGFKDVAPNMQFSGEIAWAKKTRVSTGWADGTFRPLADVQRQAVAAFLYRLSGSPKVKVPAKGPFKDVPANHQFAKALTWAKQTGIMTGWGDGTARGDSTIDRNAMAAFLHRFALKFPKAVAPGLGELDGVVSEKSKLVDTSSDLFEKDIRWMERAKITTGYPAAKGREYRPLGKLHRDAMIAFLYRLQNNQIVTR
ncbi:hypothetical protein BK816_08205 [Boudabousia tangfeifanii]|uniref:Repeat protein n=1 Tax=Boudabousia tangfeifanii TaxID=1912795 RepID=A0A1D9MLT6_9ACTO|nr:S-layer homology domain-containing protein [Boudabousia tangfeifanii]AOZ73267.1 hypothetical protein BK816_08205 [Boudabousia tangfeifanii]